MVLLAPATDTAAADWIVAGLSDFAVSVLSLVPNGFSAYVRIFHPAHRGWPETTVVPWAEIAAANGTRAHPGMQLPALTRSFEYLNTGQPGVFDRPPQIGSLPAELAAPLGLVLARYTTTPQLCWFAVWNGFGALSAKVRSAPTFRVPSREYHLLRGPLEAVTEAVLDPPWSRSPKNLWWPDDHSWCVATEIDLNTTYVGCGDACRDAVLALSDVEAIQIDPATGISWRSDPLNPSP